MDFNPKLTLFQKVQILAYISLALRVSSVNQPMEIQTANILCKTDIGIKILFKGNSLVEHLNYLKLCIFQQKEK